MSATCAKCGVRVKEAVEAECLRCGGPMLRDQPSGTPRAPERRTAPVTWYSSDVSRPPIGVPILAVGAHTFAVVEVGEDTPPMPAGMLWCLASAARAVLLPANASVTGAPAATRTVHAVLAEAIASAVVREFHLCEMAGQDGALRRLPDDQARAEIAGLVDIVMANTRLDRRVNNERSSET